LGTAAGRRFIFKRQKGCGKLVLDFVCFDVDKGPSAVINCNHQLNITKALMEKSTADVPGQ
ncbi:hypothetical protein, partial [uncultured Oscillibacter sp.]|uniref:hypothetical protein n=1 Tax=uncultured Oscillibacter sp. TaxID=876091 RepID=UPI00262DDE5E